MNVLTGIRSTIVTTDIATPTELIANVVRARLRDLGRTQEWLGAEAARVAGRAEPWKQTTVSAWLNGTAEWTPSSLFAVERVLSIRPGELSRHAGWVPASARPGQAGVEAAVMDDPRLSATMKRALIAAYREMRV